uniref:Ras-associating domain-containing protein n=1 Tax=Globodera pallida TaxID=36090 RepID=A0A183BKL1_GLOPA
MSVVASHRRQMAPPQSSSEGEGGGDAPPAPAPSSSPSTNSTSPTSPTSQTSPTTLPPPPPSNGVILRQRPAIPPKPPQLDIVRFSMAQAKDEIDLDTILSELLELETQLSGEAGDRVLLGPSLASSKFQPPSSGPIHKHQNAMFCAAPIEQLAKRVQFQSFDKPHSSSSSSSSSNSATIRLLHTDATDFCASPDADSAFGDSSSTESAHQPHIPSSRAVQGGQTVRNLELFSVESFRGSLNTIPSPIQQISPAASNGGGAVPRPPSSAASYTSALDERKALKIREALEKMKEAKIKKVFVFIFLEDGTKRGLLVDERWTVAESMRQLADKLNVPLTPEHAIVEEYPHLHFKRIYEDHEHVVENLENWISESPNKLHFVRLPQKWALFRHPQHFLLTNRNRSNDFPSAQSGGEWDGEQKQRLLDAFLREDGGTRVPELEGWLMLKADGKKSWRRHFFVLRSSGLYYVPKAGKPRGPARDLHCLMSVFNNQVYTCTDWRRKYKAPTDFGFAIKHPRIQMKTSKYIKYICCDDQFTFRQWLTALRITKNGCPALHKDFCAAQFRWRPLADAASSPVRVEVPRVEVPRVEVPRVSLQRLATLDSNFIAAVSSSSPRHRQPLQFGRASPSTTARTPLSSAVDDTPQPALPHC